MNELEILRKKVYEARKELGRAVQKTRKYIVGPLSLDKPIIPPNSEQMGKDFSAERIAQEKYRKLADRYYELLRKTKRKKITVTGLASLGRRVKHFA